MSQRLEPRGGIHTNSVGRAKVYRTAKIQCLSKSVGELPMKKNCKKKHIFRGRNFWSRNDMKFRIDYLETASQGPATKEAPDLVVKGEDLIASPSGYNGTASNFIP